MNCPFCDFPDSKVIDTRPTEDGMSIRRRRECLGCEKRFTTYEQIETMPVIVIKQDKSRQAFDREKVLKGLLRACIKRPVSTETLENIVNDIEQQLANNLIRECTTDKIGEMVLEHLKDVDQVAYVRFASVYRDFKDIESFMEELEKLKD